LPAAGREDLVVAIGRWQDPQKDVALLTAALRRYLRAGGLWKFALVGSGGEAWFGPLQAAHPRNVEYRGVVPLAGVVELLGRSRILLCTSRWESGPIVATEALLRGCSLVGPDSIPSFRHLCARGTCGTTFAARSGRTVAAALAQEAHAWESGARNAPSIAAAWKGRFTADTVCRQILAGLEPSAADQYPPEENSLCLTGSDRRGRTRPG
jgi:glycosyltransferase involved in cell wall biosynthesis